MNLLTLVVSLCCVALLGVASAHPVCSYERLQLAIVTDEESCKQACVDYSSNLHGACFAYTFDPYYDDCEGYVLTEHDEYADTTECGLNTGFELKDPDQGNAQGSVSYSYSGCSFYSRQLGSSLNAEACRDRCVNLVSDEYAGCAAWFYEPESERCDGLLAELSRYTSYVCDVVGSF